MRENCRSFKYVMGCKHPCLICFFEFFLEAKRSISRDRKSKNFDKRQNELEFDKVN